MVELALLPYPELFVSDAELDLGRTAYTVDTVERYAVENPEADLHLLLGVDSFNDLMAWRRFEDLIGAVRLVVLGTAGRTGPGSGSARGGRGRARLRSGPASLGRCLVQLDPPPACPGRGGGCRLDARRRAAVLSQVRVVPLTQAQTLQARLGAISPSPEGTPDSEERVRARRLPRRSTGRRRTFGFWNSPTSATSRTTSSSATAPTRAR